MNYKKFRAYVEEVACNGEITEEKLLQFIANYNNSGGSRKVVIDEDCVSIIDNIFRVDLWHSKGKGVDALLEAMYVLLQMGRF